MADEERLNSDELIKLRLWLAESGRSNERVDGAISVEALAEACGMDSSEVLNHLRQIRAEKAFDTTARKRKSQRGMIVLAVAMFGVAGLIYAFTPKRPPTLDEMIQTLNEKRAKNKTIHYPVEKEFNLGDANPPKGFAIELAGRYVIAKADPSDGAQFGNAEVTTSQLAKSIEALCAQAQKLEKKTPPPKPDKKLLPPGVTPLNEGRSPFGMMSMGLPNNRQAPLQPNEFLFGGKGQPMMIGMGTKLTGPPENAAELAAWRSRIAEVAKEDVDRTVALQRSVDNASQPDMGDQFLNAPAGFNVSFEGKTKFNFGAPMSSGSPIILPLDKEFTVKKLDRLMRVSLRRDLEPPQDYLPKSMKTEQLKTPIPPFSKFQVIGPNGINLTIEIPTERSAKYPTAADVARAEDAVIADFDKRIDALIEDLNNGAGKRR